MQPPIPCRRGPRPALFLQLLGGIACFLAALFASVPPAIGQPTAPLEISTATLPSGEVGTSYLADLAAIGGAPPYSWSIASGAIPAGLILNSSGVLSGLPGQPGRSILRLRVTDSEDSIAVANLAVSISPDPIGPESLAIATRSGRLSSFQSDGSDSSVVIGLGNVVALAPVPNQQGDWVVSRNGRVVATAGAPPLGSVHPTKRTGAVVGIAPGGSAGGIGYWIATSNGRIYYRGVPNLGAPQLARREHVLAIAASPKGLGYWLLTSRDSVDGFGAAHDLGEPPVGAGAVAIAPTNTGDGYWVVTASGKVFSFGDATFLGSAPASRQGPVVAITASPSGTGYWIVTASGQVFDFGTATALGQIAGANAPLTVVAATSSS